MPVDTAYPAGRIAYLLEDAAPALVVTAPDTAALVPGDALVLDGEIGSDQSGDDLTDADRVAPLRRSTRRTCSTPPAPPAARRAWWSSTGR
ncbi:hypothetical protein V2I01_40705 [Micromonospora sp. BRA006-A]|nr:hypothetical protein [Micromonospora sp. BRA006-A]